MHCPGCSRPLPEAASRCPHCGAIARAASGAARSAASSAAPSPPPGARRPLSDLPTADLPGAEAPGASPSSGRRDPLALAPGSLFAERFLIVEKIGEGGMGEVYKAIDTRLDGPVALKMIRPATARHAGSVDRFKDEVRIARQISHPSVSRVHDLGEIDGQVYLSMEWIQGETLRQLLRRAGSLEADRAIQIAAEIAGALEAAHQHGVVHRDLKPENVMIDERGEVHVMDFGIAVLEEAQGRTAAPGPLGTPGYMAPGPPSWRPRTPRSRSPTPPSAACSAATTRLSTCWRRRYGWASRATTSRTTPTDPCTPCRATAASSSWRGS
ncbi:MAG TPA: protein kinase [Patescibacteria group bacterium]|nr:protein kinase [Patescibacteria group bacterium]